MQKINYPLIVSDFDGTLVRKDHTVSKRNSDAIIRYVRQGGKFAISTGRMPAGIINRAKELGLQGMVCCCQGAIIMDIETGKVIQDGRIPFERTYAVCKRMEELGVHYHVYDLWEYYTNKADGFLDYYESATGCKAVRILDRPLSEFVLEKRLSSYKILAMVKAEDNDKLMQELAKTPFEGCLLTKSSDILVEVVNQTYSKGTALAFLAKHYQIPINKTVGIGDQWNDVPMIQTAGIGAAVANADQALKDTAEYICRATNEEDAVAEIIEKFGFTEE